MRYRQSSMIIGAVILILALTPILGPTAWAVKYKTLYAFTGGADGSNPNAGLVSDAVGNLYGTAYYGGASGVGTVFELVRKSDGTYDETVLYAFTGGADGGDPHGPLIFDDQGNLYGTTEGGGSSYSWGTVFKLSPNHDGSWTESTLYTFQGWWGGDGGMPMAGMTVDRAGNLYGTTYYGGNGCPWYGACGTVFELATHPDGSWTESILYSFTSGDDGETPMAGVAFDATGNLYAASWQGFYNGYGAILRLVPNPDGSWTPSVLHTFIGGRDGAFPRGTLVFDSAGNLYGTTSVGGVFGDGNILKGSPQTDGTWTGQVLHQFTGGKDGGRPFAGLTFDGSGSLYGTTSSGGVYGYGSVFRLAPLPAGGWKFTALHEFLDQPGDPGANPWGGVIFDATGNLYGTTAGDGTTTFGTVFEITP